MVDVLLRNAPSFLKPRKPSPRHFYDMSIGHSDACLAFWVSSREHRVSAMLYIKENKDLYHFLHQHKDDIEQKLGFALEWLELPDKKASRIVCDKHIEDLTDKATWPEVYAWLKETAEALARVFQPYLQSASSGLE